ncbi:ketosynthase chain-length factor [Actinoallomurus sp. CA-150999]|uniref:ketosynthase chain-length factor n=1 Tax=Actinoallomurus sp. CA-150999 TaxID=3239887 RepID=UPI003D9245DD
MREPGGRALVTGLAAVAPNGADTREFWASTLAGVSGLRRISRFNAEDFPVRIAGLVPLRDGEDCEPRLNVQTDRWTQLALVAGDRALADAGLVPAELPAYDMAVITASSSGGNEFGQREIQALWSEGPRSVGPFQSIAWFYAATTGQLSIKNGMKGPCGVLVTEQAGGLDALGQARRALRRDADVVLTGGTEAPVGPYALTCQLTSGLLSTVDDPARAYLPFDVDACGHVPGEGGAILVVENEEHARARGARVYGEVAGYAATFDPRPGSGRPPTLARAIEGALADAGVGAADVDVVFADGAGVPDQDRREAEALTSVFGPRGVPVTAPKTLYGRLYAGGPPLDVVAALLAIRDGVIPPTYGGTRLAPGCDLDLVREARHGTVRTALLVARGFDGFNAALVVRAA